MVETNNDVEIIREQYELHGFRYLSSYFTNYQVELEGHRQVGRHARDISLSKNGTKVTVEVKGSQLIDINGPKWQRVKLTRKDYDSLTPPDLYLFIYDVSQVGSHQQSCNLCHGPCNFVYKLVEAEKIHKLVKNKDVDNYSLPISKISQIEGVKLDDK